MCNSNTKRGVTLHQVSFQFLTLDAYDINQEDRNGQTPLMLAVILGEEEIIRLLVRAGKYCVIYFDRSDVMRNP